MEPSGRRRCFKNAGQVYYGDVLETEGAVVRHGQGLQLLLANTVDGESVMWGRYKGGWKNGKMDGVGHYRWNDGTVYEGSFVDGQLHGAGTLTWPEGSVYDGMWVAGEMSGQGCFLNAFDGISYQGVFYRNNFRLHDGSWLDVRRKRELQRQARIRIGAAPTADATAGLNVSYCEPQEVAERVLAMLSEPPHLVPLVLADASCPQSAAAPAPLWCMESGPRGCTAATTVHLCHAAAEFRRRRDSEQIFRGAVREALLTGRPLTLVFGDPGTKHVAGEDEPPLPEDWSLNPFLGRLSLPPDIFDLQHFHGVGDADVFLPPEKRGWRCGAEEKAGSPAEGAGAAADAADAADGGDAPAEAEPVRPPTMAPATLHLLRVALLSQFVLHGSIEPDVVREHVSRRFAGHVPLHRVSVLVVTGPR